MQIEVRDQVLDIWRSVIAHSWDGETWRWGGRSGPNSISDAEQLLCILYPGAAVPEFKFDDPDQMAPDVRDALSGLGNERIAPRKIVDLLFEYVTKYRDEDGPSFAAGGYMVADGEAPNVTDEQRGLEVVDSYSMSVTLMLSAIGFARIFSEASRDTILKRRLLELEKLCSERLTSAMVGLLRSFSVNIFDTSSFEGQNLLDMVNQTGEPDRIVAERLSRELRYIRTSLQRELRIGSGLVAEALDDPTRLFQPGWSWGVVAGTGEISYGREISGQRKGYADDRPYLYFTVVAMDGIQDIFSERTRILGLLDDEQQRLAGALRLRFELCLQFWNRVALFGQGTRWPVEDLPWKTTDGLADDYYSLLMASLVVQGFTGIESVQPTGLQLERLRLLFDDLAKRARITRRPEKDERALDVHAPGMRLSLMGSEALGPQTQQWTVSSYASLLLKRIISITGLVTDTQARDELRQLSDVIWVHLRARRLATPGAEDLWDQPGLVLPISQAPWDGPSWYHTERVVEVLVSAASLLRQPPPVSDELSLVAADLLQEAQHIFDQEKLRGTAEAGFHMRQHFQRIESTLDRARALVQEKPGTSRALTTQVLRELDALAVARLDPLGGG